MSLVTDSTKKRLKVGTLTKLAGAASFLGLAGFCAYGLSRKTNFSSVLINSHKSEDDLNDIQPNINHNIRQAHAQIIQPRQLNQSQIIRNRITKTYAYLLGSVLVTALSTILLNNTQFKYKLLKFIIKHPNIYMIVSLLYSVLTLILLRTINFRKNKISKHIVWILFNIGVSLNLLFIPGDIGTTASIVSGTILTSISVLAMSSPSTKFLKLGSLLGVFLGVLLGVSILQRFFPNNNTLDNFSIYGGLATFGLFTAYDTQKVLEKASNMNPYYEYDPINAQIDLYLDAINFFIDMVRLLLKWKKQQEEEEERKRRQQKRN